MVDCRDLPMSAALKLGRYSLFGQLASGGMATVYLGRLNGEAGFGRTVAIKRLHPHLAREPEFVMMFLDEAHMAARVHHPNVAATLDIVSTDEEIFLVMEYIQGESLGGLLRAASEQQARVPLAVTVSIGVGLLGGLHAAHDARDEQGRPLAIVHRDVSPQNVLVGLDGVARLLDFGVARASARLASTRDGQLKGKLRYMAPEQLKGVTTQQTDIYAAGLVLWEGLTGRRVHGAENEAELVERVHEAAVSPPSRENPAVPPELDAILMKALAKDPRDRWATAGEMAEALDTAIRPASARAVGSWVQGLAGGSLQRKAELVALAESGSEPRELVAALRASGGLPKLGLVDTGSGSIPPVSSARTGSSQRPAPGNVDDRPTAADASPSRAPGGSSRRPPAGAERPVRMNSRALPGVVSYLERLPNGLDSYPQCQIKGAIVAAILGDMALPRPLGPEDVPGPVLDLVLHPPSVSTWLPEAHYGALVAAINDLRFGGSGGGEAFDQWVLAGNRALLSSALYKVLFLVVTPERVFNGAAQRWSAFHRGSDLSVVKREAHAALLRLTYPPRLFADRTVRAFGLGLQAAGEAAGCKDVQIRPVVESDTTSTYDIQWK